MLGFKYGIRYIFWFHESIPTYLCITLFITLCHIFCACNYDQRRICIKVDVASHIFWGDRKKMLLNAFTKYCIFRPSDLFSTYIFVDQERRKGHFNISRYLTQISLKDGRVERASLHCKQVLLPIIRVMLVTSNIIAQCS